MSWTGFLVRHTPQAASIRPRGPTVPTHLFPNTALGVPLSATAVPSSTLRRHNRRIGELWLGNILTTAFPPCAVGPLFFFRRTPGRALLPKNGDLTRATLFPCRSFPLPSSNSPALYGSKEGSTPFFWIASWDTFLPQRTLPSSVKPLDQRRRDPARATVDFPPTLARGSGPRSAWRRSSTPFVRAKLFSNPSP